MASSVYTAISQVPGAGRPRKRFSASAPPPGYYDPAIDASVGQANRGLYDLGQDISRNATRLSDDYGQGVARTGLTYGRGVADIERSYGRGQQDVGLQRGDLQTQAGYSAEDDARARSRLDQDRSQALEQVARRYATLATTQRQAAQGSGVAAGGFFGAAKGARDLNAGLDRAPIEQAYARNVEDLNTGQARRGTALQTALGRLDLSEGRGAEDYGLATGRALEDRDLSLADATKDYGRGTQDLATQLGRGIRENVFYGQDALRSAYAQATANGWRPPTTGKRRKRGA
jgi:hypothetical protein